LSQSEKLLAAFRKGLALPASYDVTRAESASLPQWDSVGHLQLMVAIEDSFGVRLKPADVVELTSYSSAIEILRRRGAWQGG